MLSRQWHTSLLPGGKRRVVGEKPRRLATGLAVQVANASNLAGVIRQVCGLVIGEYVSEPLTRYGFAVRRRGLFLQASRRLRTENVEKLSVEALQLVEVHCKSERDGVDGFPGRRRGDRGHGLAALDAAQVPFAFNAKVPDDHVDRVRLREGPPVNLVFGEV